MFGGRMGYNNKHDLSNNKIIVTDMNGDEL